MSTSSFAERVRIGVNPIVWSNDDFHDLGGRTPLERCLEEARASGYDGIELGHKFPRTPLGLRKVLEAHGLALVSGWHSTYLLERSLEEERKRFAQHLDLLGAVGCEAAIVAECSRSLYTDPKSSLELGSRRNALSRQEWGRLAGGLDRLAELALSRGLLLAYHPHVGTLVQNEDEIDVLMERTALVGLLWDSGHLALAGAEPKRVLERHAGRIVHVHLKNVRKDVAKRVRSERCSFSQAVREGVFTVPGDGGMDYAPILERLAEDDYRGWIVVEAEQDPEKAPPRRYAEMARRYLREVAGL